MGNEFVRDLKGGIFVVVMLFFAWERKMVIHMFTCLKVGIAIKRTASSYPACALSRRSRLLILAVWVHDILGVLEEATEHLYWKMIYCSTIRAICQLNSCSRLR